MIRCATKWVPNIDSLPYLPDDNTLDWICKPYILSQRFKQVSCHFSVRLLGQGLTFPLQDELKAYPSLFKEGRKAFVREVLLTDNDVPLSYGRVIIPLATYHHFFDDIEAIGKAPFGESFLYSHPDLKRSDFEYQHLTGFDIYPQLMEHIGEGYRYHEAWSRRSQFNLSGHPLVVIEVFMPNLPLYPKAS